MLPFQRFVLQQRLAQLARPQTPIPQTFPTPIGIAGPNGQPYPSGVPFPTPGTVAGGVGPPIVQPNPQPRVGPPIPQRQTLPFPRSAASNLIPQPTMGGVPGGVGPAPVQPRPPAPQVPPGVIGISNRGVPMRTTEGPINLGAERTAYITGEPFFPPGPPSPGPPNRQELTRLMRGLPMAPNDDGTFRFLPGPQAAAGHGATSTTGVGTAGAGNKLYPNLDALPDDARSAILTSARVTIQAGGSRDLDPGLRESMAAGGIEDPDATWREAVAVVDAAEEAGVTPEEYMLQAAGVGTGEVEIGEPTDPVGRAIEESWATALGGGTEVVGKVVVDDWESVRARLAQVTDWLNDQGLHTENAEVRAAMNEAEQYGYVGEGGTYFPPGPRAMWEAAIGTTDDWPDAVRIPTRIVTDLGTDPRSYLGALGGLGRGLARAGSSLAGRAAAPGVAGRAGLLDDATRIAGRAIEGVGNVAQVPNVALNQIADTIVEAMMSNFGFRLTDRAVIARTKQDVAQALQTAWNAARERAERAGAGEALEADFTVGARAAAQGVEPAPPGVTPTEAVIRQGVKGQPGRATVAQETAFGPRVQIVPRSVPASSMTPGRVEHVVQVRGPNNSWNDVAVFPDRAAAEEAAVRIGFERSLPDQVRRNRETEARMPELGFRQSGDGDWISGDGTRSITVRMVEEEVVTPSGRQPRQRYEADLVWTDDKGKQRTSTVRGVDLARVVTRAEQVVGGGRRSLARMPDEGDAAIGARAREIVARMVRRDVTVEEVLSVIGDDPVLGEAVLAFANGEHQLGNLPDDVFDTLSGRVREQVDPLGFIGPRMELPTSRRWLNWTPEDTGGLREVRLALTGGQLGEVAYPPARPYDAVRGFSPNRAADEIVRESADAADQLSVITGPLSDRRSREEVVAYFQEIDQVLRNRLDEAGLHDVSLTYERIDNASGRYFPGEDRIELSVRYAHDLLTAIETTDHESIHALRDLDLFDDDEWNILANAARRFNRDKNTTFWDWAIKHYNADYGGNEEMLAEEAIAEMYAKWRSNPDIFSQDAQVTSLMMRIDRFLKAVAEMFRMRSSRGDTYEEILQRIATGEVGGRRPGRGMQNIPDIVDDLEPDSPMSLLDWRELDNGLLVRTVRTDDGRTLAQWHDTPSDVWRNLPTVNKQIELDQLTDDEALDLAEDTIYAFPEDMTGPGFRKPFQRTPFPDEDAAREALDLMYGDPDRFFSEEGIADRRALYDAGILGRRPDQPGYDDFVALYADALANDAPRALVRLLQADDLWRDPTQARATIRTIQETAQVEKPTHVARDVAEEVLRAAGIDPGTVRWHGASVTFDRLRKLVAGAPGRPQVATPPAGGAAPPVDADPPPLPDDPDPGPRLPDYLRGGIVSDDLVRILNTPFRDGPYMGRTYGEVFFSQLDRLDAYRRGELPQQLIDDVERYYAVEIEALRKAGRLTTGAWTERDVFLVAEHRFLNDVGKDLGEEVERIGKYDFATNLVRELALYNIVTGARYALTNAVGNVLTSALTGHWRTAFDALASGEIARSRQASLTPWDAQSMDIARMTGRAVHATVDHPAVRDELGGTGASYWERVLGKGPARHIAKVVSNKTLRSFAVAADTAFRSSLYREEMTRFLGTARADLVENAMERNRTMLDWAIGEGELTEFLASLDTYVTPEDLRSRLADLAASRIGDDPRGKAFADRVARDWANRIADGDRLARSEVERVFFTFDETSADRVMRRFFLFHHWSTRASALYVSEMFRHPALARSYFMLTNELDQYAERNEFPDRLKRFLKLWNTPIGFAVFANPFAIAETFVTFQQSLDADEKTALDRLLHDSWVGRRLFLSPMIDSALNFVGLYGDTFAPDPFMTYSIRSVAGAALNFVNAQTGAMGGELLPRPYEQTMGWVRSQVSGVADWALPFVDRVGERDPNAFTNDRLNWRIYELAKRQAGNQTTALALALEAIHDPDNPLYREAYEDIATLDFSQAVARSILPGTRIRTVQEGRQEAMDLRRERSAAFEEGREPTREQEQAADTLAITRSGDPVAGEALLAQTEWNEYVEEGGDPARVYDLYRQATAHYEAQGMDHDAASAMARAEVARAGLYPLLQAFWDERGNFEAAHPTFKAFKDWQRAVLEAYPDLAVYRRLVSDANPNAARHYEAIEEQSGDDPEELDRRTIDVHAWFAITGVQESIYGEEPLSTNEGAPFTGLPTGTVEETARDFRGEFMQDLAQYEAEQQAFNQVLGMVTGQPGIRLEDLHPLAAQGLGAELASFGVNAPDAGPYVRQYQDWARANAMSGNPTDPTSFLDWRDAMYATYAPFSAGAPLPQATTPEQAIAQLRALQSFIDVPAPFPGFAPNATLADAMFGTPSMPSMNLGLGFFDRNVPVRMP